MLPIGFLRYRPNPSSDWHRQCVPDLRRSHWKCSVALLCYWLCCMTYACARFRGMMAKPTLSDSLFLMSHVLSSPIHTSWISNYVPSPSRPPPSKWSVYNVFHIISHGLYAQRDSDCVCSVVDNRLVDCDVVQLNIVTGRPQREFGYWYRTWLLLHTVIIIIIITGLVVACLAAVWEIPGSNHTSGSRVYHDMHGHGMYTLQCLGRLSLLPSVGR